VPPQQTADVDPPADHDVVLGLIRLRRDIEIAQLLVLSSVVGSQPDAQPRFPEILVSDAAAAGIDEATFRDGLAAHLRGTLSGSAGSALTDLIDMRIDEVQARLKAVPATMEKAHDWVRALTREETHGDTDYEAYVLLGDQVDPARVGAIAADWKKAWRAHREKSRDAWFFTEAFWISRNHEDLFDDLAHYRFYERFALGEFDALFDDLERRLGASLLDLAGSLDPFGTAVRPDPDARAAAQAIWLVSRARQLPVVLADVVGLVLRALSHATSPDGSWPSPVTSGEGTDTTYRPDTMGTAAAVIAVFKLSTSDAQQAAAARAVEWLVQSQEDDGHWAAYGPGTAVQHDDSVLATALALEAILRSGRPNVERLTERAAKWLIAAQGDAGGWHERSLPNPLLSVVVLESLELWNAGPQGLSEPLLLARDLLRRSQRLATEDTAEARQLAVVAAHTGIEAFMYVILSHPTVNEKTVKDKETIGLRRAMTRLQDHYHAQKLLPRNAVLPHRNGVDRLAILRDEIVHKALRVSRPDIDSHLREAQSFTSAISLQILGRDLLQS
jgi:Squalene-hopene cyclase C-terminal domain